MRILATLDVPTLGDALIDGFSVVNDPDRVRTRLGFMPDYLARRRISTSMSIWTFTPGRTA